MSATLHWDDGEGEFVRTDENGNVRRFATGRGFGPVFDVERGPVDDNLRPVPRAQAVCIMPAELHEFLAARSRQEDKRKPDMRTEAMTEAEFKSLDITTRRERQ